MNSVKYNTLQYLQSLSCDSPGVYQNCTNGQITLYASCFAVMCYHYLNELLRFPEPYLKEWADYLLSYQGQDGRFRGPEIIEGKLLSAAHSPNHLAKHSTCHVLPALKLLGVSPRYPLVFMDKYLEPETLVQWLEQRNWNEAWLEGNNLLFMGQLLTYIAVEEDNSQAKKSVDLLFEWLDDKIDPATGLWGTDRGATDNYAAAYGGYHQLLLYYYWGRPIPYRNELVDTILSLQHFDGGFARGWGGGSCEDVDCVDILVNLYKLTDYRREDIKYALLKARCAVLRRQVEHGGFVYKVGEDFYHMGMEYTYAPSGDANMFSTWFGVHTLCLIAEIIEVPALDLSRGQFNDVCSMGWHHSWDKNVDSVKKMEYGKSKMIDLLAKGYFASRQLKRSSSLLSRLYQVIK